MYIRSPRQIAEENSELIQDLKLARAQIKDLQEEVEALERELAAGPATNRAPSEPANRLESGAATLRQI